jgi:hypothetical protein
MDLERHTHEYTVLLATWNTYRWIISMMATFVVLFGSVFSTKLSIYKCIGVGVLFGLLAFILTLLYTQCVIMPPITRLKTAVFEQR